MRLYFAVKRFFKIKMKFKKKINTDLSHRISRDLKMKMKINIS